MGHYLNRAEEALMAFFLGLMTLLTFVQVVLRYAFNTGLIWSLEATVFAFIWLVLLGMSSCVRTGTHIAVDVVINTLSPPLRRAAVYSAISLCLIYTVLMGVASYALVERLMDLGNNARDIPLPRWLLLVILPIGFLLLGVRLVQAAVAFARGERDFLERADDD